MLVATGVLEGDDALPRPALRLALVDDLRLGVERVAVEERLGEGDLGESEVRDDRACVSWATDSPTIVESVNIELTRRSPKLVSAA
ncbi:hypothetical protein NJ76_00630 [Rhodococcus sp. IITR03]|nr:hypothetical protein NJ76_00630 [Rhodococcus sp. IITR03]